MVTTINEWMKLNSNITVDSHRFSKYRQYHRLNILLYLDNWADWFIPWHSILCLIHQITYLDN